MDNRETPYRFDEADTHCIVELKPELNKAPWGEIDSIGTALVERMRSFADSKGKKSGAFLIDLSSLNYMGSAMVALVVRLWKLVKEKNGKMAVVNKDATVLEVLRLSGLEDVWTIVESHEEGFRTLGLVVRRAAGAEAGSDAGTVSSAGTIVEPPPGAAPWAIAAVVLLAASAVGLFFLSSGSSPVTDLRVSLGLLFGAGVLGLIPGTVATCLGLGMQRTAGVAGTIGCLALLVAGVVVHPERDAVLGRKKAGGTEATGLPNGPNAGPKQNPDAKQKQTTKSNGGAKTNEKSQSKGDTNKSTGRLPMPKAGVPTPKTDASKSSGNAAGTGDSPPPLTLPGRTPEKKSQPKKGN